MGVIVIIVVALLLVALISDVRDRRAGRRVRASGDMLRARRERRRSGFNRQLLGRHTPDDLRWNPHSDRDH